MEQLNQSQALTRRHIPAGQDGFSLIEMMVSMAIFLFVSAAMYGLVDISNKARNSTTQRGALLAGTRTAMLVMGRDAFNAGFGYPKTNVNLPDNKIPGLLNIPPDINTTRDSLPAVIAGKQVNLNSLVPQTASTPVPNRKTDQVTFVYQDATFNRDASNQSQALPVNAPTLLSLGGGLDEIIPISGNASSCRPNDIMLITGRTSTTVGIVTGVVGSGVRFAGGDVLGINTPNAGDNPMRNIEAPTSMRRVTLVTYRILADGTLVRTLYGNDPAATVSAPSRDEPLVYGVEDMIVEYVLDDGQLTRNPISGPDGIAGTSDDTASNQALVRQVRVTLVIQSSEKQADGKPYRVTLTTTFNTRNLGYDNA